MKSILCGKKEKKYYMWEEESGQKEENKTPAKHRQKDRFLLTERYELCIIFNALIFSALLSQLRGRACSGHARRRVRVTARLPSPDFFLMEVSCNVPYLSAQEAPALQGARFPQKNGNCQRPQGSGPSSCQGPRSPDPLRSRKVHPA